jgi:lactoylglutathione lyase
MTASSFLGLRSLIYSVKSLDEAKAWYTKVLGESPYFDEPFYVGFNVGGFELGLFPGEAEKSTNAGSAHGYWGVNDVDAEYARLLELGAKQHTPLQDVGGDIRLGTVLDPFGNIFGVIYNPHFKLA